MQDLVNDIEAIAVHAGDAILAVYGSADFHVVTKADHSPLTAADTAAHEAIVTRLRAAHARDPDPVRGVG